MNEQQPTSNRLNEHTNIQQQQKTTKMIVQVWLTHIENIGNKFKNHIVKANIFTKVIGYPMIRLTFLIYFWLVQKLVIYFSFFSLLVW